MKALLSPIIFAGCLLWLTSGCRRAPESTAQAGVESRKVSGQRMKEDQPSTETKGTEPWTYRFTAEERLRIENSAELQALLRAYCGPYDASTQRINPYDLFERLSAEDLRLLILEIGNLNAYADDSTKWLFASMGRRYPAECASLLSEITPHCGESIEWQAALGLRAMAEQDAPCAVGWIDRHAHLFSREPLESIELATLKGIAKKDPDFAFATARQWELDQNIFAVQTILESPESLEGKAQAYQGLRRSVTQIADSQAAEQVYSIGMSSLGAGLGTDYERCPPSLKNTPLHLAEVSAWLETMSFSQEELNAIFSGFRGPDDRDELSAWMEWIKVHTDGKCIRPLEDLKADFGQ